MMKYNFDQVINRKNSDSIKWNYFPSDVLPLWVADMDFVSPQPVIEALQKRINHGVFGYPIPAPQLREVIIDRLKTLYGWDVKGDEIEFLPGVVTGFNAVIHALTNPGEGVLMQPPVYPPFLSAPQNAKAVRQESQLVRGIDQYQINFEDLERQIASNTRMFLFCNPHNPVGRVFLRDELEKLAEIILRNHLYICSDEIHCDLIFSGNQHIPIASIDREISKKTITVMAPSKTFNIAGLGCSFAVVQNQDLKTKLQNAYQGLVSHVNILGYTAALAAYQEGGEWLEQILVYLENNRDYLVSFVDQKLPGVKMTVPQGTYLAWLDFSARNLSKEAHTYLMEKAKIGLNDGEAFGAGGKGFVRLNFGCPRSILEDSLKRLQSALFPS